MSRKIKLTKGKYAIVDDDDYDYLSQWRWKFNNGYAVRNKVINSRSEGRRKYKIIMMHRVVNKTTDGLQTDHINRDKLDNRKENLRSVTASQNKHNAPKYSTNTSGYKGVRWNKVAKKWNAHICINYQQINLGFHKSKEEAFMTRQSVEEQLGLR